MGKRGKPGDHEGLRMEAAREEGEEEEEEDEDDGEEEDRDRSPGEGDGRAQKASLESERDRGLHVPTLAPSHGALSAPSLACH